MRVALLTALAVSLAACSTVPAVQTACPPVKAYSAEFERGLAKELQAIADGSYVALAVVDYGQLRAAARACARAKSP